MVILGCGHHERKREIRREAILAAAHDLFLDKGYEATTLSDIVGRSGGSLATLYEMFEGKPGLLRALVSDRCSRVSDTIDRAASSHKPPREALREIAEYLFDKIIDASSIALFKAALAQPELGRKLYEAGPANGQAKVAKYLALESKNGNLSIDDPVFAAQLFFQMMFGHFHQQMLFGMPVTLTAADKARHFEKVMAAFFKIYGPESSTD
jgi:TetR/AcrR family transcriptional repressor of mexJK operon